MGPISEIGMIAATGIAATYGGMVALGLPGDQLTGSDTMTMLKVGVYSTVAAMAVQYVGNMVSPVLPV